MKRLCVLLQNQRKNKERREKKNIPLEGQIQKTQKKVKKYGKIYHEIVKNRRVYTIKETKIGEKPVGYSSFKQTNI